MKPMIKSFDTLSDLFWPFNKPLTKNVLKTNISKRKGNYVFDVEIPGYRKDDIKVQLKDGYLNIWVNNTCSDCDESYEWLLQERFTGDVSRSYYIGCSDDTEVNATYHEGILTIVIPEDCTTQEQVKYINIK